MGLAVATWAAEAAPAAGIDCIVFARTRGATLWVDGRVRRVPTEGMRVGDCSEARFADPSVRVIYGALPGESLPMAYDSSAADRDLVLPRRIALAVPIRNVVNPDRSVPVPAGRVVGVMAIQSGAQGSDVVAIEPAQAFARERDTTRTLTLKTADGARGASLPLQLRAQTCLDEQRRIVACDAAGTAALRVAAYRVAQESPALEGEARYLVAADRAELVYAGASMQRMRGLLELLDGNVKQPDKTLPVDRFEGILTDLAIARAMGDAQRMAAARERMRQEFPDLYGALSEMMVD